MVRRSGLFRPRSTVPLDTAKLFRIDRCAMRSRPAALSDDRSLRAAGAAAEPGCPCDPGGPDPYLGG